MTRIFLVLLLLAATASADSNILTLKQGMQLVLERSPEIKASRLQARSGALEIDKAESKLGWELNSTISAEHDVSFIGTPVDRNSVTAGLTKPLSAGGKVGVSAGYTYEDSTLAFSPSLPNPSNSTRADISYRMPLAKDRGNVEYHSGLKKAQAQRDSALFDYLAMQDSMGRQFIERYHAAAFTNRRLAHARESLERSRRLLAHTLRDKRLGLSERKDQLQVKALVHAREAELKGLEMTWVQQRNALNRMMMQPWDQEFAPVVDIDNYGPRLNDVLSDIRVRDPYVGRMRAFVEQAKARIDNRENNKRDTLDLVISAGYRGLSGEDESGVSVSETDKAGRLSIEYQTRFDKRGVDAELLQARLDYDAQLQQLAAVEADMEYNVSSLHVEILRSQEALKAQRLRLDAEKEKYKEGLFRYRDGRIDISQLIRFEDDLSAAELAYTNEEVLLAQRQAIMSLWRGTLMQADVIASGEE